MEKSGNHRNALSGLSLNLKTIFRVFTVFRQNMLLIMFPLLVFLFVIAILIYFFGFTAPLAPFVYPLL